MSIIAYRTQFYKSQYESRQNISKKISPRHPYAPPQEPHPPRPYRRERSCAVPPVPTIVTRTHHQKNPHTPDHTVGNGLVPFRPYQPSSPVCTTKRTTKPPIMRIHTNLQHPTIHQTPHGLRYCHGTAQDRSLRLTCLSVRGTIMHILDDNLYLRNGTRPFPTIHRIVYP